MELGLVHEEEIILDSYHCNAFGDLTLPGMLNLTMAMASHQERAIGGIRDYMRKENLLWVITHNHYRIYRLPKSREVIRTGTAAQAYNAFFTQRQFWIRDQAGKDLVVGETHFTVLNRKTRKIVRIPQALVDYYQVPSDTPVNRPPRLKADLKEKSQVTRERPRFLDVDGNGHVNNTIYFTWLTNSLGRDWFEAYQPRELWIKYEHEILPDQEVDLVSDLSDQGLPSFQTRHLFRREDKNHAIMQVDWEGK